MSYGFISGFTDADEIRFCPFCGAEIGTRYADGTAECDECGRRCGVIETEDERMRTEGEMYE